MKNKTHILAFLFLLCSVSAYGEIIYQNSKKLGDELYIYDSQYQKLVPLINNNVNTIHFYLDTDLYKEQFIHFKSKGTVAVFVNNKLYKKFTGHDYIRFSIDEIKSGFSANKHLITLYSPQKLGLTIETIAICTPQNVSDDLKEPYTIIERGHFMRNQSILFAMLLIFVFLFAIQSNLSPYFFRYVYNPLNLFRDPVGDDLINMSRIDAAKIFFMLLDCIMISFIYIIFKSDKWSLSLFEKLFVSTSYIILLFIFKYVYNQIVAYVFRLSNYSNVQFFQFLRHSMIFTLGLLCMYLIFSSPFTFFDVPSRSIFNILLIVLTSSYIIKVIFSLKKVINLRSFYFISYICVSELIPVILFLVYYFSRIDKGIS